MTGADPSRRFDRLIALVRPQGSVLVKWKWYGHSGRIVRNLIILNTFREAETLLNRKRWADRYRITSPRD